MKSLILLLAIFLTALFAKAQQDPQFSHNMFSHTAYNPAAAGINNSICATLMHRLQWVGFDGAPTTSFLGVDGTIKPFGVKSGIGLTIIGDQLGFEDNYDLKLAYAYHADVMGGNLSIGMNFGLVSKKIGGDWIPPTDGEDMSIPTSESNSTKFDMGFGLFYKRDRLYMGLSAKHLLKPALTLSNQETTSLNRHFYLSGGYRFSTPIPSLEVEPSFFAKTDGSSFQFSINANAVYNKKFWGGVSYRAGDAMIVLLGLELVNNLRFGYAYDITTSDIGKYSDGTHEVFIKYCFEISVPQYTQKYKSARFL